MSSVGEPFTDTGDKGGRLKEVSQGLGNLAILKEGRGNASGDKSSEGGPKGRVISSDWRNAG